MRPRKFKLPCDVDSFSETDKKVVIVSVFGKSQYRAKGCKTDMLSSILQLNLLDKPEVDQQSWCEIEGYYNPNEKTVYLHLRGFLDAHMLQAEYDKFTEKQDCKDFLSVWAHMKDKYARALLVLFHISHVMVLTHPTHTFDYSYVHLFRAMDIVRQKISPQLSDVLSCIHSLPKDWISNARPCSPRVLFYFETCPAVFQGQPGPDNEANIKKLEHSLEDQIYHVLRKNRIVTNISSNSLFAIPANQEFVYVHTGNTDSKDMLGYMARKLVQSCKTSSSGTTSKSLTSLDSNSVVVDDTEAEIHSFRSFLQQHINLAFARGFDDNVSRHSVPAHFEIPTLNIFCQVANKVFDYFIHGTDKELLALHNLLDTDVKFSKSRCSKVLPRALQAYQENLPQHYTRAYHESKLAHAMGMFEMHARGPLFEEFSEKLQAECDKHWRAGRQMCEVLSLTGHPCTNPVHRGGSEGAGGGEQSEPREDDSELPVREHCSGVRYVCACNCGRIQGSREDPFSLKQANYDYFQMLAKQCGCAQLELVQFPVFQPSTHNYRAAQLFPATKRHDSFSRNGSSTPQDTQACSLGADTLNESTDYGSGGQSPTTSDPIEEDIPRLSSKTSLTPSDSHKVVIEVTDSDAENSKGVSSLLKYEPKHLTGNLYGCMRFTDKSLVRQPSTTEYLPGMLHTESPAGLLPQFSSWSLICLGPSSLYSHNLGLQHQVGVFPTSAFLLPWDVTVRLEHQKERNPLWPLVGDHGGYSSRGGKNFQSMNAIRGRKSKGGKEFVVKIFVGVEYECPRGHRFMASAPDKVLKATGSGIVKDSGNKVTSSTTDMPLYFPCPCRQTKPLIAQLMRIHVVTPKAPVHVTLNPRVQPGPPPCPIFVTGCEEPIKLSQSTYWILRLPYVYMGEKGPYLPPKEPIPPSHGRLLAGMYGISEVVPEKK
ncbi:PREDICTED: protein SMG8-like isoform X2 [Wasmannia auropunctata]|uniref:protein SMG8-like isoform X2 n=1 Tax=Wasmannia auropunctata TaxID=64793 RepID=UPI0005EEC119|nr:PREDICTED: protein SMG8-like isoform X2 [Wasmannia auropunctata]